MVRKGWIATSVDGRVLHVPEYEPICYLAEIYENPEAKKPKERAIATTRKAAWDFVDAELEKLDAGIGHVVILDLTFLNRPVRVRCLGKHQSSLDEKV